MIDREIPTHSSQAQHPDPTRRDPTSSNSTTAHDPISDDFTLKTGFGNSPIFFVDSIGVTSRVAAGGTVTVEIGVTNAATRISGGDPDVCRDGLNDGFEYRAIVDPSWQTEEERTVCLGSGMASPEIETFEIPAPAQGGQSYNVDVTVENANSGGGGTLTRTVTVPSEDDGGGDDDDAELDPGVGDDDTVGGGDNPFEFPNIPTNLVLGAGGAFVALLFVVILISNI